MKKRGLELVISLAFGCKTYLEKLFFPFLGDLSKFKWGLGLVFCLYFQHTILMIYCKVASRLFQKLNLLIYESHFTTS